MPSVTVANPMGPDDYFYNCSFFWPKSELCNALVWALGRGDRGEQHGVTGDQLPTAPPQGTKELLVVEAYQRAVYKSLNDLGVIEAYRRHLTMDAQIARCPWWCAGEHARFTDPVESIAHERQLGGIAFTEKKTPEGDSLLHKSSNVRVLISAWQDDDGKVNEPIIIFTGEVPDGMDVEDATVWSEVLASSAKRFEEITAQQ
jgi:hypothetical protein